MAALMLPLSRGVLRAAPSRSLRFSGPSAGLGVLRRATASQSHAQPPHAEGSIRLSHRMTAKVTRGVMENIDLMVCDMAGTTVEEGGLVYKILQQSMKEFGLVVSDAEIEPWHGAKKESVIEHFARQAGTPDEELEPLIMRIGDAFVRSIDEAYFSEASTIEHIDVSLVSYFTQLRTAGVKVALNTGYPRNIQEGLVKKLALDKVVDDYISAYEVPQGRPFPYMIHTLMQRLEIMDVRRVAKVGDSVRDIEEGHNAGCGLVVGVLSGADSAEALFGAGADVVVDCVVDLPLPRAPARHARMRLPDLS